MRVGAQRSSLLCGVIFLATLASVNAQSKDVAPASTPDSHSHVLELPPFPDSQTKRLTVDDVIKMSKAKVSDDAIIEQLKKEGQYFSLTTDQLLQLKTARVSKQVIQVMIDPYPIRDSPPSSPEKTDASGTDDSKAAASNLAALRAQVQYSEQCRRRCWDAYQRCQHNAYADLVPFSPPTKTGDGFMPKSRRALSNTTSVTLNVNLHLRKRPLRKRMVLSYAQAAVPKPVKVVAPRPSMMPEISSALPKKEGVWVNVTTATNAPRDAPQVHHRRR